MPQPESDAVPSMPPPVEKSVEDQPFTLLQKNVKDLLVDIDLTPGSYSLSSLQIMDLEALNLKAGATLNSARVSINIILLSI